MAGTHARKNGGFVNMKKLVALIMVCIIAFSMAACGGKKDGGNSTASNDVTQGAVTEAASSDEAAPSGTEQASASSKDIPADVIPKETVTLTVYDQLANYSGEQIGWFAKVMLDKFNVKLNIIPESDGTFETRMESGNLGDIVIWGDNAGDYKQAVEKGMLFNFEDEDLVKNYGPYITENCATALEADRKINGGSIYGIGNAVASSRDTISDFQYTWDIRWDLYEQIGKPEVKNLDDMFNVLVSLQAACPTDDNGNPTYAVSMFSDWDGDTVNFPADLVKAYYGLESSGFGFYNAETQEYYDLFNEKAKYIEALKFYNKLFQKGLADPDSQTQGWNGFCEDMVNGTALWNTINWMASGQYNTDAHLSAGKGMFSLVPKDAKPLNWGQMPEGSNRPWSIGANTEYPELCMAIINWLFTPEGVLTSTYGPKDVCWNYGDDGKTHFTDLGLACSKDGETQMSDGYTGTFKDGMFYMNNLTWSLESINPETSEPYQQSRWASSQTEAKSDIEQKWRDWSGYKNAFEYITSGNYTVIPGVSYALDQKSDELSVVWNQVAECIRTNSWKAMYAASDDEFNTIIEQMQTDAKAYGYDQCIEWWMTQVEKRKAAENAVK
jgi:multiple sugar transport system substrate-binding protein/putative aldouronate transport system substrate-binding protein